MTRTLIVTCLGALTLAGCGRTIVRETVVERPVETVVERPVVQERIIERPTVAVAPPASCLMAGTSYGHGSLSCQAGYQYRCSNGAWDRIPNSYC